VSLSTGGGLGGRRNESPLGKGVVGCERQSRIYGEQHGGANLMKSIGSEGRVSGSGERINSCEKER